MNDTPNMGLLARATAYRVKYRKVNHEGQPELIGLRIQTLGIHKKIKTRRRIPHRTQVQELV